MTPLFAATLILHVLAGLIGLGASYGILIVLFKRVTPLTFLRWASFVALISYIFSWITGGYYYVLRYGAEVKPIILSGAYPWAHTFGMETKEHIFLFIPILAAVITLIAWIYGKELSTDQVLRQGFIAVVSLVVIIGTTTALLGILVSGASR